MSDGMVKIRALVDLKTPEGFRGPSHEKHSYHAPQLVADDLIRRGDALLVKSKKKAAEEAPVEEEATPE